MRISRHAPYAVPFVAALATLLLGFSGAIAALDLRSYDWRLSLRRDAGWPQDLVLVPIDDASMHAHGRWPWPRDKVAGLVDEVRALGAKTILFDLIPSTDTDDPAADAKLAAALRGAVVPIGFTKGTDNSGVRDLLQSKAFAREIEAPSERYQYELDELLVPRRRFLEEAGALGHPIFDAHGDGRVRLHTPFLGVKGLEGALPSIGLVALLQQRGHGVGDVRIEDEGRSLVLPTGRRVALTHGDLFLDMVPGGVAPRSVAAHAILDASVDRAALRQQLEGSLALVHLDSVSAPDVLSTPLSAATPGGLLQAHVIRTLDLGRAPRELPPWLVPLLCFAVALAAAPALARRPPGIALAAGVGATALVVVAGAVLAAFADLFFNFAICSVFLLVFSGLLAGWSSRQAERERRRLHALLRLSQTGAKVPRLEEVEADPLFDAKTQAPSSPDHPAYAGAPVPADEPVRAPSLPSAFRPTGAPEPASKGTAALLAAGTALAQPVEVGRYVVERTVGKGGMGAIFLARDRDLDRVVAIKVLEASGDRDAFTRFRREALAVARLVHPNVVQIFEVGFDAEAPYIVMEYVAGGTLSDRLRDPAYSRQVPWVDAARIVRGLARGLGAAHEKGIVHRDVKPSNVLLVEKGGTEAKIADFGIAKLAGAESLTMEGSFVGTVGYLSPEQAMGLEVDARSDVYSLGLTWFRMLTGRPAFDGTTAQVLRASVQQAVPDPRRLNRNIPEPLAALVMEMTALDRGARPTDGNEVARRLDVILEDLRLTGGGSATSR